MVFDAGGDLIETDDGGIYRRTSPRTAAGDWLSLNGTLQISEIHDLAYDTISNILIAGDQDTGTPQQTATGSLLWRAVDLRPTFNFFSNGDGGDVAVDAVTQAGINRSIRYSSFQNLGIFRLQVFDQFNNFISQTFINPVVGGGGPALRPQFITPIALNANTPARLVIGGGPASAVPVLPASFLFESNNQGATIFQVPVGPGAWNGVNINAVAYGDRPGGPNADFLYVGSGNQVWVRTGGPAAFLGAPAPLTVTAALPGIGANDLVTDVVLDPANPNVAFAVTRGPSGGNVFQTRNAGGVWRRLTGTLSQRELFAVEIIPGDVIDLVVVGGSTGVFVSLIDPRTGDASTTWTEFGVDLPNVPVWDLDYDAADDVLAAGTLGRGAWILGNVQDAAEVLLRSPGRTGDVFEVDLASVLNGIGFILNELFLVGAGQALALIPDLLSAARLMDAAGETVGRLFFSDDVDGAAFAASGRFFIAPSVEDGLASDADPTAHGFQELLRVTATATVGGSPRTATVFVDVDPDYSTTDSGGALVEIGAGTLNQLRLEQRLAFLGFPDTFADLPVVDGVPDAFSREALQLFQAATDPDGLLNPGDASGVLDADSATWLNHPRAPRWIELIDPDPQPVPFNIFSPLGAFDYLPGQDPHTGARTGATPQAERFGTDWLLRAVAAAASAVPGIVINGLSTADGVSSEDF
ncbi:MAG: hypothetical protein ACRD2T_04150, partial [Thermoanaerobaculia bacterium]